MPDQANLKQLFHTLGVPEVTEPDQLMLFWQAVTHKSYLLDNRDEELEYDRLEFLGDSILKFVINSHLFQAYPSYNSGELTKLSAVLLSDKTLLKIANSLELKKYIRTGGRIKRDSVLSDVVESVLGACFLVYKLELTQKIILRLYENIIPEADSSDLKGNYKAALQELSQSMQLGLPDYVVVGTSGPPHNPSFEVEIRLGEVKLGSGFGSSKKEAGQAAAKVALKYLQKNSQQFRQRETQIEQQL